MDNPSLYLLFQYNSKYTFLQEIHDRLYIQNSHVKQLNQWNQEQIVNERIHNHQDIMKEDIHLKFPNLYLNRNELSILQFININNRKFAV